MPTVQLDFTEINRSHQALALILGPPGDGAFAACPGDPVDNAPRAAIFYPNTVDGRGKYMRDSAEWESRGRNNFFNSVVWHSDALKLERAPLVIGPHIRPLRFPVLWCDMDQEMSDGARALYDVLTEQSNILNSSGGKLANGKPKFHLRLLLDQPITDIDTFYTMNRWFSAALGADSKFSPVAWLTLPGSTRFKAEYPNGRAVTRFRTTLGRSWSVKTLRRKFIVNAPEPTKAARAEVVVELEPTPVEGALTVKIRGMLRQKTVGDRSTEAYKLIRLCAEAGYSKEQALWVTAKHAPSYEKYGDALAAQVVRCWPETVEEVEELADYGGTLSKWVPMSVIGERDYPEVVWCVPDLISEGLNLLVAPPKAGKSWFVLDVALACATGGLAFGMLDVTQRPVLYMALEDSHRRLKQRAVKLMGTSKLPAAMVAQIDCDPNQVIPNILEFLLAHAGKQPLIILDTLGRARGTRSGNEDAYSSDYMFMTALKNAIDNAPGATLLAVHHTRKTEGADVYDSVNGSNGITGGVDSTLVLKRKRQSAEARLHVTGREVGENAYAMVFDDGKWALEGVDLTASARHAAGAEEPLSERMRTVLACVEGREEGTTPKEVAMTLKITPQAASMYLKRLTDRELITKKARGLYAGGYIQG